MLVKSVAVIGNESVLIQLPVLKYIYIYISNRIYESNFVKQHSETVMVYNHQNADCS